MDNINTAFIKFILTIDFLILKYQYMTIITKNMDKENIYILG